MLRCIHFNEFPARSNRNVVRAYTRKMFVVFGNQFFYLFLVSIDLPFSRLTIYIIHAQNTIHIISITSNAVKHPSPHPSITSHKKEPMLCPKRSNQAPVLRWYLTIISFRVVKADVRTTVTGSQTQLILYWTWYSSTPSSTYLWLLLLLTLLLSLYGVWWLVIIW